MPRIESGASWLSKEPMNLAEQVEQMDDIIRPQTEQKGQRFVMKTLSAARAWTRICPNPWILRCWKRR